jgi:hypothetical protein
VESHPSLAEATFETLQSRLIALVNFRIRNGEFTERGLARMLQVSQPQMHNVLKGQRKLQWDLADALLSKLNITILDLLNLGGHEHFSNSGSSVCAERAGTFGKLPSREYPSTVISAARKPPSKATMPRLARALAI